jgi:hypothetical protein
VEEAVALEAGGEGGREGGREGEMGSEGIRWESARKLKR